MITAINVAIEAGRELWIYMLSIIVFPICQVLETCT